MKVKMSKPVLSLCLWGCKSYGEYKCNSSPPFPEPPGPPTGVQVRAVSSKSITVLWSEPEVTNGAISNYSVVCFNNNTRETIINKTVTIVQPQTEFFLEPDTTYICSVIAFNIHGPSLPQQAVGTTLPIPSKLITTWKYVVYYTVNPEIFAVHE